MDERDNRFRSVLEHKEEEYKAAMAQAVAMAKEVPRPEDRIVKLFWMAFAVLYDILKIVLRLDCVY